MKIKSVILALIVLAVPVFATGNYPLTTPFASGSISAVFPTPDDNLKGIVKQDYADVTSTPDHTNYTGHEFSSTTKTGRAYFSASYFDYSAARGTDAATLDGSCDGGLSAMKLVLVPNSRENMSFASLYAREAEGVNDTYDGFIVVSTVGTRAYIGIVVFEKSLHATIVDANYFFQTVRQR